MKTCGYYAVTDDGSKPYPAGRAA